jgi:hypothetical protein
MYGGQCEMGYISEERFDLAWLTCHTKINETNFILAFYCCSIWDTDLPSRRLYPMHVNCVGDFLKSAVKDTIPYSQCRIS